MQLLKRSLFAGALAAALAVPAIAPAGTADYGGRIDRGGKIGIDTNGGTSVVDQIRYEKFPARCNDQGGFIIDSTWIPNEDIPVENGEFAANLVNESTNPDSTLEITGRFRDGDTKIKGTIKAKNVFSGGSLVCKTRRRDYVAKQGNDTTVGAPKAAYARR